MQYAASTCWDYGRKGDVGGLEELQSNTVTKIEEMKLWNQRMKDKRTEGEGTRSMTGK